MEFHISSKARKKYQFEESLFSFKGNIIFANFHAARVFAQRINEKRDLVAHPELTVRAGQVNAMGLIDEIFHHVIALYRTQKVPLLYQELETALIAGLGKRKFKSLLRAFTREFPPTAVFQGKSTIDEYLEGETDHIPHRHSMLEELLMLWLANQNPAFQPYQELFFDTNLRENSSYEQSIQILQEFFSTQPGFGPDDQNLVDMLRSPAIAEPTSLKGQLDYIRTRWGNLLGHYLLKLLGSLDLFSEEERLRGFGPGPVPIPVYGSAPGDMEVEHFSPDAHWMPRLVLMAKNTYVWLDQLSKHYQRPITRLDQIPDEELDKLADWGITGLWLIGLWERSRASARIKQLCGNTEAIASAYSLKDYRIAQDLGGEEALAQLRSRCWQRGIRLASDMVPNHMAIDSNWVYEHPDWFVSLPYSPFPSYSFNGPNLSEDDRKEIFIEDHYYDRSDAAVVFKYHDKQADRTHYIYHGNDGTSMPWNDTAQLNYLDPNVREAVIKTILDVAHRFPIIRFDAAMTLAKRHYQRLWYPLPGGGCDIPSRSDFNLSQEIFDQYIPQEFWREVVDRVAAEAPDTLLLAEAFWLMEGYFVRTLGMHRVYNSAFMNLLRDEDNSKYRQVMKNTLEFDPEILKRFVNFMNNPDEESAVTQFGKGDKYFGICTLMATMPGLPMFGHGQVEGLREKYGMEYKRAYWDEQPDQQLIERHTWQIFPLLKQRYLFANVEQFYLYDFYNTDGFVDENVFAYSNRYGEERSLVVYHNHFGDTSGWVRTSAAFMDKKSGEQRQVDLRAGLDLPDRKSTYILFRDRLSGLEYIRNAHAIAQKGLYIQLDAYRAHVFMGFQIVEDDEQGSWRQVHEHLNGRGVSDIHALQWELPLKAVLQPLRDIVNPGYIKYLLDQKPRNPGSLPGDAFLNEAEHRLGNLVRGAVSLLGLNPDMVEICTTFRKKMRVIYQFEGLDQATLNPTPQDVVALVAWLREDTSPDRWLAHIYWCYLDCLRQALNLPIGRFFTLLESWRVFSLIESTLRDGNITVQSSSAVTHDITLLFHMDGWLRKVGRQTPANFFRNWVQDRTVQEFLQVNTFNDRTWINAQNAKTAFALFAFEGAVEVLQVNNLGTKRAMVRLGRMAGIILSFLEKAEQSGYDLDRFIEYLE